MSHRVTTLEHMFDDIAADAYSPIEVPAGAPVEIKELVRAVESVHDAGLDEVEPAVLAAMVGLFDRLRCMTDAVDLRFVDALDDSLIWADRGHANVRALLRTASNLPTSDIGRRVACVRRRHRMPAVVAAFDAGMVSIHHVRVLAECTANHYFEAFVEAEADMVRWAIDLSWEQFVAVVAKWKESADQREATSKGTDDDQRKLHVSTTISGLGALDATLTKEQTECLRNVLDPIVDELFRADWAEATDRLGEGNATPGDLIRTPAQRRADALQIMAERAAAAANAGRPTAVVYVMMGLADLEHTVRVASGVPSVAPDAASALCELSNGTSLTYVEAAELLIDAHVRRVVFDTEGEVVDFGRRKRWFTRAQKEAMVCRDRFCRCGCGAHARRCHADHRIEWRHDGPTDLSNAQALCPAAHRLKTNGVESREGDGGRGRRPG